MDYGILRICETEKSEIEAVRAFVTINAKSEKILFGNAAVTASEDLKSILEKVKQVTENIGIHTEAMSVSSNAGILGKNSTANYSIKLTINDLNSLGAILGICSEGKKISIRSVSWDYDEDAEKLNLIKKALRKAKHKAEAMMEEIGYSVIGIRSCSDSYVTPNIGEVIISGSNDSFSDEATPSMVRRRSPAPTVDFGAEFKSKKQISATCVVEFLVRAISV
jgi:hypothetical protein